MKKILLTLLGSVIFYNSYAGVSAFVDKTSFYAGDNIKLTITANGSGVKMPDISQIGDYPILATGNSSSINILNGKQTSSISKTYVFSPNDSLIIPSFEVIMDNKTHTTKEIKITKLTPSANKAGDDFILKMQVDKTDIFVGEKAKLVVNFYAKKGLGDFGKVNISPVVAKNIEFSTDNTFTQTSNKDYNIWTLTYDFVANDFGTKTIANIFANLSKQTGFGFFTQNNIIKKIYSNALTLTVKPLPDNLTLYGDFTITFSVDKSSIQSGEAVNGVLKISGEGNIKDIAKFNLNIANATIYADEPEVENNKYIQKFAIIAGSDFIIPKLSLSFLDKQSNIKKTISTKEIKITVTGESIIENTLPKNTIQNNNISTKKEVKIIEKNYYSYYFLIIGIIVGILITIGFNAIKGLKHTKNKDLITQIKTTKNNKELFTILAPLNIKALLPIMQKLEANLYRNAKHKINKKDVVNILKHHNFKKLSN